MCFIIIFIRPWSLYLLFADKGYREIIPVCVFASYLGSIADYITHYFPYSKYFSADLHPLTVELLDDLAIFPIVTYLFIQWLPKEQSIRNMFSYLFIRKVRYD